MGCAQPNLGGQFRAQTIGNRRNAPMNRRLAAISLGLLLTLGAGSANWLRAAWCCPFCSTASQTFSEEIASMDVVAIATLIEPPPPPKPGGAGIQGEDIPKGKFEVIQFIK